MGRRWWVVVASVWCVLCAGARAAQADASQQIAEEQLSQQVRLDELIWQALRRNPGLAAKRHAYEAARARVVSAWLPEDPQIGVDVEGQSHLFRFDRTDNEYSFMQTIPFPTTLFLRGAIALRESDIA